MWRTLLRRFFILIPQLIALTLVVFVLAQFMPGDALTGLIDPDMTAEDMEIIRTQLGLDVPWYTQYSRWIIAIITEGDFGRSTSHMRPVTDIIGERAANTFRLSLISAILTYLIATPLGVIAGKYKGHFIDRAIVFYTFIALAMPTIVFAMINVFIFGFNLRWFPTHGSVDVTLASGTLGYWLSRIHHIMLPALTGALLSTVTIINLLRSEIIHYQDTDFVRCAKAKGVPSSKIYTRHIFKNASLPVISSLSFIVASLLTGSIFIEQIFSYPGMGNLFITAILQRDFPVVNGLVVLYGVFTVLGTLLADVIVTIVDPRIRIK